MNEEEIQALRERASAWVANPPNEAHEDDIEDVQMYLAKDNLTPRRIKALQALIKGSRTQYVISEDEMSYINICAREIMDIKTKYPTFRYATQPNARKLAKSISQSG